MEKLAEGRLACASADLAAARRGIAADELCTASLVAPKRTRSVILFMGEHTL